jgi:hypothetical protein
MKEDWEVYEFLDGETNFYVSNLEEDVEFFINIINRYLKQYGDYSLISVVEIIYHDSDFKDYDFLSNLPFALYEEEDNGLNSFIIERL